MKKWWILVAVLGVIIVILFAILFFYNPAKSAVVPDVGSSPQSTTANQ